MLDIQRNDLVAGVAGSGTMGRGVVQVLDGLAAGDQVVVGNVGMLGAGMQVQLIGGEAKPAAPGAR